MYNVKTIVQAIPRVAAEMAGVLFVFLWPAGTDQQALSLRSMIQDLGVERSVRLVGPVEHDRIHLYYRAADVFVSIPFVDVQPASVQEAMACGAMPITSQLATLKHLVKHDWNGFLVNPHDCSQVARAWNLLLLVYLAHTLARFVPARLLHLGHR